MRSRYYLLTFLILCLNSVYADYGLKIGSKTPINSLETTNGSKINLLKGKQVLVFYRGSWCPYCITQLKSLESEVYNKLPKNVSLIAISVDRKSVAKKMIVKQRLSYHIISDPKALLLKKFNLVNKLPASLVSKYKNSYGIDVEGDSGETHHLVAHPGVVIIKNGKITFFDVHTNYKQRTNNAEILSAL